MGKRGCCNAPEEPHYILISLNLLIHLNKYEPNCSSGWLKAGAKAALQPLLEQFLELSQLHREGHLNIRGRGRAIQINPKKHSNLWVSSKSLVNDLKYIKRLHSLYSSVVTVFPLINYLHRTYNLHFNVCCAKYLFKLNSIFLWW